MCALILENGINIDGVIFEVAPPPSVRGGEILKNNYMEGSGSATIK